MAQVIVTDRQGDELTIEIRGGTSLMQAITDAGVSELLALCGGMCSCATCHVYIEPEFLPKLCPMGADEDGLLEMSEHRRDSSRLACQVRMSDALDGMRVQVAPEN